MREWEGIRRDTDDTANGCLLAVNANFYLDGEMNRRAGMSLSSDDSGTSMANFSSLMRGNFVVFATSTGTVEAVTV